MSSVNKCLLCLIGKVTTLWKSYNPSERSQPLIKVTTFHERGRLVLEINKLKGNPGLWWRHVGVPRVLFFIYMYI
uniref:Putative ovule protein n=1 Tax=Solanum chacoense TaxID=4108 RepID=A0A0V0GPX6_SOLCH